MLIFLDEKAAATTVNSNQRIESISSTNLNNHNLSALSPSKSQLATQTTELVDRGKSNESLQIKKPVDKCFLNSNNKLTKDYLQTDANSNQSLNQPLSSRNNSSASYIYPSTFLNTSSSFNNRSSRLNNNTNCDRTTRMLLSILILFLITEVPSGILNLLSGLLGKFLLVFYNKFLVLITSNALLSFLGDTFFNNVYINLGEVIDLLALINNGVNFIILCSMSRQFRKNISEDILL